MRAAWLGVVAAALIGGKAAAAGICTLGKIATFPVTMVGSQPQVIATLDGRPMPFMIDSGAFYSLISPGAAIEAGLSRRPAPQGFFVRGIGGLASADIATVKSFSVAGIDLPRLQFIVAGSEVGSTGVLGQNFLHVGDVEYDLAHGQVSLFKPKGCNDKTSLAYWVAPGQPYSILELQESDGRLAHTVASVLVNGQRIRATFDTGAHMTTISLSAARRLGITPDSPGVIAAGFGGGVGSRMVRNWIVPIASIKLDAEEARNDHILMTDMSATDFDMLIGADFFLSHRVYVANSQHRLYVSYVGGTAFQVRPKGIANATDDHGRPLELKDAAAEPTDAEAYGRRGMAAFAKDDRDKALADLDRAVALAPNEARFLLERAQIHARLGHPALAEADLDKAVSLSPADPAALIDRAVFRMALHQPKRALADAQAASPLLDKASDRRFALGEIFLAADALDQAIAEFDRWIAVHPVDSRMGLALNGRCRARALLGRDLARALSDCNGAMRTIPRKEVALDSRGLVRLRMGDAAGAVKDYDAALAIRPKMAWSLYGRGLARARLGQKEAGDADIVAAIAIRPRIADEAGKWGVTP